MSAKGAETLACVTFLGEDIDFASHVLIKKCQWNNPAAYLDESQMRSLRELMVSPQDQQLTGVMDRTVTLDNL